MAQVMFRCPYSNKPIFAGIELHVHSIRQVASYPISVHCPHCGFRHHGTIADGCLADEGADMRSDLGPQTEQSRPADIAARMKKR